MEIHFHHVSDLAACHSRYCNWTHRTTTQLDVGRKHDVTELLMRMRDWPTPAGRLHHWKLPLLYGTGQEECLSSSISMGSPVTGQVSRGHVSVSVCLCVSVYQWLVNYHITKMNYQSWSCRRDSMSHCGCGLWLSGCVQGFRIFDFV